ncbi:hypothetical protein C8Q79DRAFT_1009198 [Trametes meyenii]|nr:hypothetical protein C8Q79DRAFT_1009198 [Trametes meyenii]
MSLFLSPLAVTPLLKVPVLLSQAVCTYHGMKPPTPKAQPKEQARFAKSDFLGRLWTPDVMVNLAVLLRATLCGLAVVEAAAVVAETTPSHLPIIITSPSNPTSLSVTPIFLVGGVLAVAGGLIRIACHRTLGKFFTWQMSVQDDHKLVTTGPYAVVRHPSYSGWLLLVAGNVLALLSPGSYYVENGLLDSTFGRVAAGTVVGYLTFITYVLCSRIRKEDEVLCREFGSEWQAWARKTPFKLIPFIY